MVKSVPMERKLVVMNGVPYIPDIADILHENIVCRKYSSSLEELISLQNNIFIKKAKQMCLSTAKTAQ